MIDRWKLRKTVATSWFFTLMGLSSLMIGCIVCSVVSIRFIGPGLFLEIGIPLLGTTMMTFILSEALINLFYRAQKPDISKHKHKIFVDAVEKVRKASSMWIGPRTYILDLGGIPNAMAYGPGLPGLAAIGITESLLDLLSDTEIEAVVGHEMAHIKCKDVGALTFIMIMIACVDELKKLFLSGKSLLGKGPFAYILGYSLAAFSKIVMTLARCSVSQERELAADALGAYYVGSPDGLISGLRKLEQSARQVSHNRKNSDRSALEDLAISHPNMDERVQSLLELSANSNTTAGSVETNLPEVY